MGADDNAAIVRRGYAAFNAQDAKALTEISDENLAWHTPGRSRAGGDFHGRDASLGHLGRFASETGGTFRAELQHVFADDEGNVAAVHRNTAERNGKKLDVLCCLLFRIRDGRIAEGRECFYDLYAWDEFWS